MSKKKFRVQTRYYKNLKVFWLITLRYHHLWFHRMHFNRFNTKCEVKKTCTFLQSELHTSATNEFVFVVDSWNVCFRNAAQHHSMIRRSMCKRELIFSFFLHPIHFEKLIKCLRSFIAAHSKLIPYFSSFYINCLPCLRTCTFQLFSSFFSLREIVQLIGGTHNLVQTLWCSD